MGRHHVLILGALFLSGCSHSPKAILVETSGLVFGSTYKIKYWGDLKQETFEKELKTFFKEFNDEFSTYQKDSTVSVLNSTQITANKKLQVSERFLMMLDLAKKFNETTMGAFDPTLAPIIQAWGFGGGTRDGVPTDAILAQKKELIGLHHITWDDKTKQVWKLKDGVTLDLNAFAPGMAVDFIGSYFHDLGVENYLIDISGELLAKGKNLDGSPWVVGIDAPVFEKSQEPIALVNLKNAAISTSGNYRQFFVSKKSFSHIIDPKTLRPVDNKVCSATVIAKTAVEADAWGTALMVLGEKGLDLAEKNGLAAFLIICENKTKHNVIYSKSMRPYLLQEHHQ